MHPGAGVVPTGGLSDHFDALLVLFDVLFAPAFRLLSGPVLHASRFWRAVCPSHRTAPATLPPKRLHRTAHELYCPSPCSTVLPQHVWHCSASYCRITLYRRAGTRRGRCGCPCTRLRSATAPRPAPPAHPPSPPLPLFPPPPPLRPSPRTPPTGPARPHLQRCQKQQPRQRPGRAAAVAAVAGAGWRRWLGRGLPLQRGGSRRGCCRRRLVRRPASSLTGRPNGCPSCHIGGHSAGIMCLVPCMITVCGFT